MKKKFYYHAFLTKDYGNWSSIVIDQFKLMENHDLIDAINEVSVSCIHSSEESKRAFDSVVRFWFKNANITYHNSPVEDDESPEFIQTLQSDNSLTENLTMRKIYEDSQNDDFLALYAHTKGITSVSRHLKQFDIDRHITYYYWRDYLNWGVIENWKKCTEALEKGYDMASVNFMIYPYPHYSGTFWWSKSSYIRTLPDPTHTDWYEKVKRYSMDPTFQYAPLRFRDEMWITSRKNFKAAVMHHIYEKDNPAYRFLPRKKYASQVS